MDRPEVRIAELLKQKDVFAIQHLINLGVLHGNSTFMLPNPIQFYFGSALHILLQGRRVYSGDPNVALLPLPTPPLQLEETLELIRTLLTAGADVNIQDGEGATPLTIAIRERPKHVRIVLALLEAGAQPSHLDLMLAQANSNVVRGTLLEAQWKSSQEYLIHQTLLHPERVRTLANIPAAASLSTARQVYEERTGQTIQSPAGRAIMQMLGGPGRLRFGNAGVGTRRRRKTRRNK